MSLVNLDIPIEEQYKNKSWIDLRKEILERNNFNKSIQNPYPN